MVTAAPRRTALPPDYVLPQARRTLVVPSSDGTALAVQVHGPDDAPTVVLAHGWTCAAAFWARVVHRLGDRVRVVLYDQRGHGASAPAGPAGHTTRAIADDLAAVLSATVPAAERAVVAGHSMGAMALVSLAAERPDVLAHKVSAALLASTGVGRLVHEARVVVAPRRLTKVAQAATRRGMSDGRLLTMLPRWGRRAAVSHITLSRGAARADRAFCTDVVTACPGAARAGFAAMLATLDLNPALARLDVPALVLVGTADRLTPPSHSRRLAAALPQPLGLVELPGLGHMTPVQAPDAVTEAVLRLVRDHTG